MFSLSQTLRLDRSHTEEDHAMWECAEFLFFSVSKQGVRKPGLLSSTTGGNR